MAHYALITLVVKDQEKLAAYLKVGGPAVAKHEGKAIAGGPGSLSLQTPHGETRGVVLEFPTPDHLTAWLQDPELAEVHALRNAGADTTILSLPEIA
ncbi:DUF1330 domain-containing protein [Maritalea sp. S77]|uniref:DUF1330 domain-containing protein n=1 Tax=Maritalea sp. S77 TaxID=3415125 RepID=UPI003C7CF8A1